MKFHTHSRWLLVLLPIAALGIGTMVRQAEAQPGTKTPMIAQSQPMKSTQQNSPAIDDHADGETADDQTQTTNTAIDDHADGETADDAQNTQAPTVNPNQQSVHQPSGR